MSLKPLIIASPRELEVCMAVVATANFSAPEKGTDPLDPLLLDPLDDDGKPKLAGLLSKVIGDKAA